MRRFRDDRPADICFARGTFNAHPYVMGAMQVFLERLRSPQIRALYDGIKAVGAARCIMSSDAGQWLNPIPVQQLAIYMQDMLNLGLSPREIRTMTAENPARALGID